MPTAVVTGGAGFFGSQLCEYLLAEGYRATCVDNLGTSTLANIEDIRDDDRLAAPPSPIARSATQGLRRMLGAMGREPVGV